MDWRFFAVRYRVWRYSRDAAPLAGIYMDEPPAKNMLRSFPKKSKGQRIGNLRSPHFFSGFFQICLISFREGNPPPPQKKDKNNKFGKHSKCAGPPEKTLQTWMEDEPSILNWKMKGPCFFFSESFSCSLPWGDYCKANYYLAP